MGDSSTEAKENSMLVDYDDKTVSFGVYFCRKKGVVDWMSKAIVADLEFLGYKRCRISLKSDQENSVMAVKRPIAELREAPTSMLESLVRESKCNGKMERAVQNFQGQLRTLKLALEENIGVKVKAKSRIFTWLCTWACTSLNRYHVGIDGLTAFARVTGTQCSRPIAEFGKQVLWKKTVKSNPTKAETLWEEGTFLGLKGRTSEVIVADKRGKVRRCRPIRARADDERWRADRVMEVMDSVAEGMYDINNDNDNASDGEGRAEEEVPEVPEMNEEEVADLFAPSGDEDEEPRSGGKDSVDDAMSEASYDSVTSPDRLNLVENIKKLEGMLSSDRLSENKKIIAMIAAGNDVTEIFSPPRVAEQPKNLDSCQESPWTSSRVGTSANPVTAREQWITSARKGRSW